VGAARESDWWRPPCARVPHSLLTRHAAATPAATVTGGGLVALGDGRTQYKDVIVGRGPEVVSGDHVVMR